MITRFRDRTSLAGCPSALFCRAGNIHIGGSRRKRELINIMGWPKNYQKAMQEKQTRVFQLTDHINVLINFETEIISRKNLR